MATVIDSLLVELGLDTTQFDANAKRTLEELKKFRDQNVNLTKTITDSNKKTADSFRSVKNELLGLIAGYFGLNAIKNFLQSSIDTQASLGRLSRNLDMSARRLDAWGTVAEEMGDKATDSFGALQNVAAGIAEATIKGHSALTDAARANGVVLTDQRGKLLSNEDIILRFSARMAQLPRQQAIALANMAGLGGISNELLLGPEELQKRLANGERMSRVSAESTNQAERLQKQIADARRNLEGIGERIFVKLAPLLERIGNAIEKWLDSIDWDKVINQAEKLVRKIDDVVQQFGGWKTVAIALAAVFSAQLLGPLLGIVGAVARLGGLLPGVVSGMSSLGSAAGGIAMAGTGAVALGVGAAVYSPALGGAQRPDGSYADEAPKPAGGEMKITNNDLWNKVQGKTSAYPGDASQAAAILAYRSYVDPMSQSVYDDVAKDILSGKITDQTAWLANSKREAPAQGKAAPVGGRLGASQPATATYFASLEAQYGLEPGILDAIWAKETSRSTGARTSPKGAQGPFQFMPATASDYGLVGNDVNDVNKSANAAARYLADLHKQFGGDTVKVLAAYNWGAGNVKNKGLENAPAETLDYIKLAQGLSIGPQAAVRQPGRSSTSTTEVQIDKIEVHTQATDAVGIAAALPGALRQRGIVAASNTGVE